MTLVCVSVCVCFWRKTTRSVKSFGRGVRGGGNANVRFGVYREASDTTRIHLIIRQRCAKKQVLDEYILKDIFIRLAVTQKVRESRANTSLDNLPIFNLAFSFFYTLYEYLPISTYRVIINSLFC